MVQLTHEVMRSNLTLAIEEAERIALFDEAVEAYKENPTDRINAILVDSCYKNLMLVYAIQNIKNEDERMIFYIENSIPLDYAEALEKVIIPLL